MPKNNYFTQANRSQDFYINISLLFSIIFFLTGFTINTFGQILIPLRDLNSELSNSNFGQAKIATDSNFLFVKVNNKGLWKVTKDGQQATPIQGTEEISDAFVTDDWIFFESANLPEDERKERKDGLWKISKTDYKPSPVKSIDKATFAIKVVQIGSRLFIATPKGLRVLSNDQENNPDKKFDGKIKEAIAEIKATNRQIFVKTATDEIATDETTKSGLWISTDDKEFGEIKFFRGKNFQIEFVDDQAFVSTEAGLWSIDKAGNAKPVNNIKGQITSLSGNSNQLYVGTETGLWSVSKDSQQVKPINGVNGKVYKIIPFDDRLLIISDESWIINKDDQPSTNLNKTLNDIVIGVLSIGEQVVFYGYRSIWILNKDGKFSGTTFIIDPIRDAKAVGNYIYIFTYTEIYRLDPKITIKTELAVDSSWANYLLPRNWLPMGKVQATAVYADENGKDPYDETILKEFRFAEPIGEAKPSDDKFSPTEKFSYEIGRGNTNVQYWVKDKWGNTFKTPENNIYRGVPSQNFVVIFPFILSVFLILGCFALAPKVGFAHSAIMNPWLRKYFSLGSVPLLVSVFPALRRYILRRYSNSVSKDKEFTEWKTRFVSPDEDFLPENFGKRLESERRLLLTGQSGIGKTSFFKYLTACYVSANKPSLPAKVFPVYISLTNYGGNSLENLVYTQLFAYGKITDQELAPMFLEQGGLLIFLDGVNEVQNVADRQKLSEFVEKYWTSNYICLSSQQSYPEIDNITKVELKTFSKEKVNEFIQQRADDKEKAEKVIEGLTDEDYQLYSVPRDLEFAVAILNDGKDSLPKSRTELYKTIFSSIFNKWQENGQSDAENILCGHAYTMIATRDLAFDSVDNPKYKEITADLFEQKFLIKREKNYNFRHDLIRSYLASEYFYPRWQNLFAELNGKQIDSNWLEMLKFACENIENSNEVKSLVYEVLEKSIRRDVVKNLFEWLKVNHPNKCKTWEKEFYTKYGELDFKK
jgi:hypothetical protein